jgi:hypothetical protein
MRRKSGISLPTSSSPIPRVCRGDSPNWLPQDRWFCFSIVDTGDLSVSASWRNTATCTLHCVRRAQTWWPFPWTLQGNQNPCGVSCSCRIRLCRIPSVALFAIGASIIRTKRAGSPDRRSSFSRPALQFALPRSTRWPRAFQPLRLCAASHSRVAAKSQSSGRPSSQD